MVGGALFEPLVKLRNTKGVLNRRSRIQTLENNTTTKLLTFVYKKNSWIKDKG